ncbi:MAG: hypothetical protein V7763_10145 [Sulfitobacter sp.]
MFGYRPPSKADLAVSDMENIDRTDQLALFRINRLRPATREQMGSSVTRKKSGELFIQNQSFRF